MPRYVNIPAFSSSTPQQIVHKTPYDVVFALTGEVRRNSRALKQLRLLEQLGCRVIVLDLDDPDRAGSGVAGADVVSLGRPAGSGPRFFWAVHRRFARALRTLDARIYHASDLYVLPAVGRAARRRQKGFVYDARELYAFVASTAGRPWVTTFWHLYEGLFIRKADAVFTVSESIAERLAMMYGIEKPPVLYNMPEWQDVNRTDRLRDVLGLPEGRPIILHQGNVQRSRGGEQLVAAMRRVQGAELVFLGGGSLRPEIERQTQAHRIEGVHFLDAVPPAELLDYTASADIGVTLLEDTCLNHRFALPNKLFEYLMAGLPVVASDLPEIRRVVADTGAGELVDASDPASIAAGLQRLIDDPGRRSRCAAAARPACETFRWEKASERFTATYRRLLAQYPS